MKHFSTILAAAILVGSLPGLAFAETYTIGDIVIETPWARAMPPGADAGGGFMTIRNTGTVDDTLVAITSSIAARIEVHTMDMTDGVMRMRELEGGLAIPAGETVELAPGGFHVMFLDVLTPIAEGPPVTITLTFERAGDVTIDMVVVPPGAPGPAAGNPGMMMPAGGGH